MKFTITQSSEELQETRRRGGYLRKEWRTTLLVQTEGQGETVEITFDWHESLEGSPNRTPWVDSIDYDGVSDEVAPAVREAVLADLPATDYKMRREVWPTKHKVLRNLLRQMMDCQVLFSELARVLEVRMGNPAGSLTGIKKIVQGLTRACGGSPANHLPPERYNQVLTMLRT